ncbi:nitrile hydratase [Meinhardsimonia xiamenensis]|jgi:nitrile hydratase|uniref:Nitrile hydratase n=2 Tax=Meinhardsimonia xiamenensis TaxID=990712 RepID=A0A1G9H1M2_9RHOB|nr:nitrile hydratase [Meinhardsimonia xiamenensis]SDL06836.1 nitrile hydratase [Meinhardsimonia xiamenensis]
MKLRAMAERVRVARWMPPGHVRTPAYLRGRVGEVERRLGTFPNPEQAAYGLPAEPRELVRVRFRAADIWGAEAERPDDLIEAEIYGHWLEPVAHQD